MSAHPGGSALEALGIPRDRIRQHLASGRGVGIPLPMPPFPALLSVNWPDAPPRTRGGGTPCRIELLLPQANRFSWGGDIWHRGVDPVPRSWSGTIVVDALPEERRPGWDIFRAALGGAERGTLRALGEFLEIAGRFARSRSRHIEVSTAGEPDPVAWLSGVSDGRLLDVLRGSAL